MKIIKRVAGVTIVFILVTLGVIFVVGRQIEGEYDSPIIPALGDAIRLSNGEILQQCEPGASWDIIGKYSRTNENVALCLSMGPNKFLITVYPTFRGMKPIEADRQKIDSTHEYVFTRAIFGLNGR